MRDRLISWAIRTLWIALLTAVTPLHAGGGRVDSAHYDVVAGVLVRGQAPD